MCCVYGPYLQWHVIRWCITTYGTDMYRCIYTYSIVQHCSAECHWVMLPFAKHIAGEGHRSQFGWQHHKARMVSSWPWSLGQNSQLWTFLKRETWMHHDASLKTHKGQSISDSSVWNSWPSNRVASCLDPRVLFVSHASCRPCDMEKPHGCLSTVM